MQSLRPLFLCWGTQNYSTPTSAYLHSYGPMLQWSSQSTIDSTCLWEFSISLCLPLLSQSTALFLWLTGFTLPVVDVHTYSRKNETLLFQGEISRSPLHGDRTMALGFSLLLQPQSTPHSRHPEHGGGPHVSRQTPRWGITSASRHRSGDLATILKSGGEPICISGEHTLCPL